MRKGHTDPQESHPGRELRVARPTRGRCGRCRGRAVVRSSLHRATGRRRPSPCRPALGPRPSTASRCAPGTTVTPSASPTTQSPSRTSTSPTNAASPIRPGMFLVAPRNAIIVAKTGNRCAFELVDVADPAVDDQPAMPRDSAAVVSTSPQYPRSGSDPTLTTSTLPGRRFGDGDVDREVVARAARDRERGTADACAGPHGMHAWAPSVSPRSRRASPLRVRRRRRASSFMRVIVLLVQRLAEGEGFEPSRELVTPYSLSRRAPSATRSALRSGPSIEVVTHGLPCGHLLQCRHQVESAAGRVEASLVAGDGRVGRRGARANSTPENSAPTKYNHHGPTFIAPRKPMRSAGSANAIRR